MKKLVSVILTFCLLCQVVAVNGVLAVSVDVESEWVTTSPSSCGDNAYWQLDKGVLTISGTGEMDNYDYYNDRQPWLQYASQVTKIVIESGITSIGQVAFGSGSDNLDGENCIFSNLTDVQIADTVTTIYDNAFASCTALEKVTIPSSVEYIGERVFSGCTALKEILVDNESPFFCSSGGVLFTKDGTTLINYPIGSPATEYTIPYTTKVLADHSFTEAVNLEKVNFNEGLERINDEVFNSCYHLKEAILPYGLKYIGAGVFQNCDEFNNIFIPDTVEHVGGIVLLDTAYSKNEENWSYGNGLYADGILLDSRYNYFYGTETSDYPGGHFDVAPGTRLIAQEAFAFTDLKTVDIPDGVEIICDGAFYGTELEAVSVPNSVTVLENSVFSSCQKLESISLGSDIEYIGSGAFNDTLFINNDDLYEDGAAYYGDYLLDYDRTWTDEINIKEGTTLMADGAFFNESGLINEQVGSSLTGVTFPESLTSISNFAFLDCKHLNRVEIPATVTEIGDYAFGYLYNYDHDLERSYYTLKPDFTIVCEQGSAAEAYAKANGITYEYFPEPGIKAEAINITNYESIFAYSDNTSVFMLNVAFEPSDCDIEELTWTSDNESVATVTDGKVRTHGVGTANITVTSESGLTDIITVTVVDYPFVSLNEPLEVTFTVDSGIRRCYFIPDETANYTLTFGDDGTSKIDVYCNNSRVVTGSGSVKADFDAGSEYMIKITRQSDAVTGGTLSVKKSEIGEEVITPPVTVTGIYLTPPNKFKYTVGDPLDLTGLQVQLLYSNNTSAYTDDYIISGYDPYSIGTQLITVSSNGYTACFNVIVSEYIEEDLFYPTGIEVTPPSKTTYNIGEFLDSTGMVVTLRFSNGSYSTTEEWSWSGYDPYTVGSQTITVSSCGFEDTFTVYVNDSSKPPVLTDISIFQLPNKTKYYQGERLNTTGAALTLTYSNGSKSTLAIGDNMVTGYDSNKVGAQTLTVTYEGFTVTFNVTVIAKKVTSMALTSLPTKLSYIEGAKTLSTSGGVITLHYNNGEVKTLNLTKEMITGFNGKKVGKQTVTVIYGEYSDTFSVTVSAKKLTGIRVTSLPKKTTYYQGDSINTTGLKITAQYNNGTSAVVTGWKAKANLKNTGSATVTVTYKDYKTAFSVKVKALKAPTLKVTGEYFKYKLSWNKVNGAKKYTIYYRLYKKGKWSDWKSLMSTAGDITDYTHIVTVENDNKYQYSVISVNGSIKTERSNTVKVFSTPGNLKASNSNKGISLSWSKPKSVGYKANVKKYNIYRKVAGGKWSKIKTVSSTSYTDTTVKAKKLYQYRVRAVGENYESYYAFTQESTWLKAPSKVNVSKAKKEIKISWSKVTGASQYEVYRRAGSGKWTKVKVTKSTKYTDKNAKKGKTYTYRIRAIKGSNSKSQFKTGKKIKL